MPDRPRRLGALLFSGVLSACGGQEPATTAASQEAFCAEVLPRVDAWLERVADDRSASTDERDGGTAVVGSIAELVGGMNAFTSPDYAATQHQRRVGLMTLLAYDADLSLEPYLAESWEVSPDGTEITFRLRGDVSWHDGEPTTARDVVFTYLRVTDPRTGFPNPAQWDHYVRGEEGIEVVDDRTVRVSLRPHSEFMDAWTTLAIMPEHLLGDVPPEDLGAHPFGTVCPVGNGPFVFREHRVQDRWVFDANPAFPEALGGRPHLDRYVYRIIPDEATLLSELLAGGIDVFIAPSPDQAEVIAADPRLELRHYAFRNVVFTVWNSRHPALADARVRRAITMATPRQEIVEALTHGYGSVALGRVPPFHRAYEADPDWGLRHDPAAARALLERAGWTDRNGDGVRESADGTPLSFTIRYNTGNEARAEIAEIMRARLADAGVEVRTEALEFNTLIAGMVDPERRDFDGVVLAFASDFRMDDTDLFHSSRFDGPYAWSGTRNPELDGLIERLAVTADPDEADALWAEYERVLNEEQPFTFLYFPERLDGVNRRLRDVVMDVRGEWVNVGEWWIADPA